MEPASEMSKKNFPVEFIAIVFSRCTNEDLVMQVMIWPCMVWFTAIWFDTSYMNLRQPHIFTC